MMLYFGGCCVYFFWQQIYDGYGCNTIQVGTIKKTTQKYRYWELEWNCPRTCVQKYIVHWEKYAQYRANIFSMGVVLTPFYLGHNQTTQ